MSTRPRLSRRQHLGLRARVTVAFALGALALSTVLAGITFGLVRNSLVQQREESAMAQSFVNARVVRDGLRRAGGTDLGRVLASVESPGRGGVVLHVGDRWFANSLVVGRDTLPPALREQVAGGKPARQRFFSGGEAWVAVGVPIPRVDAQFFEAFSLGEVDRTLDVLGYSLAGAAVLTTMAGAAVGRWASARVLRPLAGVSEAAAAIAAGSLATRLEAPADRDLAPLADSFNRMVDALSERISRDARFASDVSHELRSPLTTLSTSLEVMRTRRGELSPRAQAALDLLDADVRRFQRMVEDLLEISRFDAGVAELELDEVDLRELVRHTLGRAGGTVPLDLHQAGDEALVLADKRRLERVVVNLLENAAAHGGGATRVGVEASDHAVRVVVEDGGAGVPLEERPLIFERFFRGSAAGRRGAGGGSGLGLALVNEHVRLHAGRVWVEDGPDGQGARFVVELPRVPTGLGT
ncbi:MAG: HAMP domain-containing histidine kinase [Actinobacteria bacterium]|nr:HAMP domain-containing histidine kinase [Actinomycetota bacterium]MBW3649396.1 HAMP domain-containing histidine kinase [Actinomycetota bacterium]